jgi:hypothetical protein
MIISHRLALVIDKLEDAIHAEDWDIVNDTVSDVYELRDLIENDPSDWQMDDDSLF